MGSLTREAQSGRQQVPPERSQAKRGKTEVKRPPGGRLAIRLHILGSERPSGITRCDSRLSGLGWFSTACASWGLSAFLTVFLSMADMNGAHVVSTQDWNTGQE